mgnify:CR=1 FL=1
MDQTIEKIIKKADQYVMNLPPLPHIPPVKSNLASYLDCALHAPDAIPAMVQKLCAEAAENYYATVFINPIFVPLAKQSLEGTGVHVGTVAGFPLGGFPTDTKVHEARSYVNAGADEIDMVMSIGMLKAGEYQYVLDDIRQVVEVVHPEGSLIKVILETALLNRKEKIIVCLICKAAGADFVKTSTGFSTGGATEEDIDLMRRVVGPEDVMGVKAAGGIHTLDDVIRMIHAGANRLGTRLAADILKEYQRHLTPKKPSNK